MIIFYNHEPVLFSFLHFFNFLSTGPRCGNFLDTKTLQIIRCIAQVRQDRQETPVLQGSRVLWGSRVLLACMDLLVIPVPLVQQEKLDHKDRKDRKDQHLADLDHLDLLDLKDSSAWRVTSVQ